MFECGLQLGRLLEDLDLINQVVNIIRLEWKLLRRGQRLNLLQLVTDGVKLVDCLCKRLKGDGRLQADLVAGDRVLQMLVGKAVRVELVVEVPDRASK